MAEEDTPIRPEWVRFWAEPVRYDRVVLAVDPAVSGQAKADASALVVLGEPAESAQRVFHLLEAFARRVPAPDLVSLIDDCDRRWNPEVIRFETNAAFLGIKDLLVQQARYGPRIKGVSQSTDKAACVAALSVSVENGSVLLKGNGAGVVDIGQRELFDEMVTFPFGEHDDILDAAAMGTAWFLGRREPRAW